MRCDVVDKLSSVVPLTAAMTSMATMTALKPIVSLSEILTFDNMFSLQDCWIERYNLRVNEP